VFTTVGYSTGDIVPVTKGGKLFATVYILVGGTILLNNMSLISMIPLELRKRRIERGTFNFSSSIDPICVLVVLLRFFCISLTDLVLDSLVAVLTQFGDQLDDAALRELATGPLIQRLHLSASRSDGLDECTREMFSLAMLVRLGKVNEQDIRETFASFRRLDVNDEGVLNSKSIIAAMIQKRRLQQSSQQNLQNLDRPPPPPLNIPQPPREQSGEQGGPANVWVDNNGAPQNTYFFQDPPREQSGEQGGPAKVWIDNNGAPQNTYFFQDPPREQSGEQQGRANVWVDNNGAPHNTYFFQDSPREQSGEHEGPASVWTDNNGSTQNTYLYQDPEAGTERSFLLPHDETTPGSYRRVSPAGSRLGQKNSPHESPF
jgi:alkylhydroperoxidase/carboxymuconolactone decarboxylase family protein YurZ